MLGLWKNIVVAALSVFLTFLAQQYYHHDQNSIKKLDVYTKFDPEYLSKPKFSQAKVKLTVDKTEKEKIGLYEILLVNFTNQHFKDLSVTISITPKTKNDFKIISHFATGENGIDHLVKEIQPMSFDGKSYIFTYSISTMNRAEKDEVGMNLSVLFEGDKEPELKVVPNGVKTRDFSWNNSPKRKKVQRNAIYLLIAVFAGVIVIFLAVIGPIVSLILAPLDRRSDKKYAQSIFDSIKKEGLYNDIEDQQIKKNIAKVLYRQRKNAWESKSLLDKWLVGLREPKRDDYLL